MVCNKERQHAVMFAENKIGARVCKRVPQAVSRQSLYVKPPKMEYRVKTCEWCARKHEDGGHGDTIEPGITTVEVAVQTDDLLISCEEVSIHCIKGKGEY